MYSDGRGDEMNNSATADALQVGSKVRFWNDPIEFTVRSRDSRYIVLTGTREWDYGDDPEHAECPVEENDFQYCIVDLVEKRRGPHNMIFNLYDFETDAGCDECLSDLQSDSIAVSHRTSRSVPLEFH